MRCFLTPFSRTGRGHILLTRHLKCIWSMKNMCLRTTFQNNFTKINSESNYCFALKHTAGEIAF